MASNPPKQPPSKAATAGYAAALVALVGAPAAVILNREVPKDEGMVYRGYLDPVGIPTKCGGDTNDVVVGRLYTKDECAESLAKQLYLHAKPVMACVPQLKGHPFATYASVSKAYNVGPAGYCRSLAAVRFRSGDLRGGCQAMAAYFDVTVKVNGKLVRKHAHGIITAGGRVLPGLVTRRNKESAICMREFAPA